MSCPPPLKPRDFVLQRSWLDTGKEQMLLSRSVEHKDYPPKKGFVRAKTYITGFVLRSRYPHSGCVMNYITNCDPQGKLPSWLVNKVTHTLGPRMIRDIRKAALGYINWKAEQSHCRKPWRNPEDITLPRISISDCCLDSVHIDEQNDFEPTKANVKKLNKISSLPTTLTAHNKSISNVFPSRNLENGTNIQSSDSLPASTTGSPLVQKKSKRKFKFKFEKKSTE